MSSVAGYNGRQDGVSTNVPFLTGPSIRFRPRAGISKNLSRKSKHRIAVSFEVFEYLPTGAIDRLERIPLPQLSA
jgi:hypothetical protein